MAYNPDVLSEILEARSLSKTALSRRLGIELDDLDRELTRDPEPTQGIINDIAKELVLPSFVFFMEKPPHLNELIPDFRSPTPGPSPKSKSTIKSIQFATAIQNAAANFIEEGVSELPQFDSTNQQDVETFALRAREYFEISLEHQLNARDASVFYTLCRREIESRRIFVLHDSFPETDGSGFCLAHPKHPVIVVNTKKQTRGRRLFTLMHELAHVLMHKSGISDPFISPNKTERLCNQFAGSFLIPEEYADTLLADIAIPSEPDLDDVRRIARRLKISQQATVLRLENLQVFKKGSHARWLKAIHNIGNPDFAEKGGGGKEPPPQEKVKLAKYGFRFASAFDNALRQGRISEINLFRLSGLKPKYIAGYLSYANSLTETELQNMELDDG